LALKKSVTRPETKTIIMRKLITLCAIASMSVAYGQQMPQYSQYHRNQYLVNPAAGGVYDFVDVTLGGRMQWAGFDNAPMTTYLYASAPLTTNRRSIYNPSLRTSGGLVRNPEIKTGKLKHAIGGSVYLDQYGAWRQVKGQVSYALHLPVAREYNLSFGISAGLSNRAFLPERAQVLSTVTGVGVDPTYDNVIANAGNQNTMDVGAGLYFYSKNLFIGVAADQITKDFVRFGNANTNFDPRVHWQFTGGYKFPIGRDLTLMPAVLAKYVHQAPWAIEGNLQVEYKEWLWGGVGYRNTDAVVVMAGLNISQRFKLGYSYDFTISNINNYSAGSHELVLGLMLGR